MFFGNTLKYVQLLYKDLKNILTDKRVLVLGGPGLVGRNVIESLISRGVRNITAVGLPEEIAWRELQKVERKYRVRIRKYSANLLVPPKFQRETLGQILSAPAKRRSLTTLVTGDLTYNEVSQQPIAKIVKATRPHLIIDCINIATQCAYIDQSPDSVYDAGIGSLLLLRYYQVMFHLLRSDFWKGSGRALRVEQYLKVGTTGIGGMGLDIPFTHGEERPSISLLKKVAMAGAQTNILLAMRNSRGAAIIQEVVPATAIFQLSGFTPTVGKAPAKGKRQLTEIDGGESRGYALEEFRLLTNRKEMGLIDAQELAEIIARALEIGHSSYDILQALEKSGVRSSQRSMIRREKVIKSWTRDLSHRDDWSIAHGNLGPWRTRKLLFELTLLLAMFQQHRRRFWKISPRQLQSELLSLVRNDASLKAEIYAARLRVTRASGPRDGGSMDRRIDLSLNNVKMWRQTLRPLKVNNLQAGDALVKLIQKYHDLRAIP